jgi:hypothetical protein
LNIGINNVPPFDLLDWIVALFVVFLIAVSFLLYFNSDFRMRKRKRETDERGDLYPHERSESGSSTDAHGLV